MLVILVGTSAQILADRLRVPATGPLLLAGLLIGKAGLGLIQPEILGDVLRVVIKAAVAIVVFEGGLLISVKELRHASRAVVGLVTVGILITTFLAGLLVHFLLGWDWELSLLFGAIVSITGPTVITPILQNVSVNRRVKTTLESESIIADPLGVILASLIFTAIVSPLGLKAAIPTGLKTLLVGVIVGVAVAVIVWVLSDRFRMLPSKFTRIGILGAALASYTIAEIFAHEAGVMAAAIAGIAIGSLNIPHKEEVEDFKGDLASIAISSVFILLASGLLLSDIIALGWPGLLIVVIMIFVVRPIRVFFSTFGSELKTNEKWFISFLGPRGIVAASIATFFALKLGDNGIVGSESFVPMVFAIILATVATQGTFASQTAKFFKVMPQHILIIGADETARILAEKMVEAGESISLIDTDKESCELAKDMRGVTVFCDDATKPEVLKEAGLKEAKCVVVATSSDKVNILISQAIRSDYNGMRLVARVNDSTNLKAFEQADIEVMSPPRAVATILENIVLRPSLFEFLSSGMGEERMREIAVGRRIKRGTRIADLGLGKCVVIAIRRGDDLIMPKGDTKIEQRDVLTILGEQGDLDEAFDRLK
ncbi:MAG: cation:proton antiporter [Acidobacteria bacterium]|nr:cation:proton antiporter [Acidobacteriota bacterium]